MTTFKEGDVVFIKDESISYMNFHADYKVRFERKTPYRVERILVKRYSGEDQEYVYLSGCSVGAYSHRFYRPLSDKSLSEYL